MSRSQLPSKKPCPGHRPWIAVIIIIFFLVPALKVTAQQQEPLPIEPPEAEEGAPGVYRSFELSLEQALETEASEFEAESGKLESVKAEQRELDTRVSLLQLMISTHSNLLLSAETGIQALERARIRQKVSIGYIREQIRKTEEEIKRLEKEKQEAKELAEFYQRQAGKLKPQYPSATVNRALQEKLDSLISTLEKRQDKIGQILEIYESRLEKFTRLLPELESLFEKVGQRIEIRKKSSIMERGPAPVTGFWSGELRKDFTAAVERGRQWLFKTAWQVPDFVSKDEYFSFLAVFLFLLALLELLLFWAGMYLKNLMQHCLDTGKFWQYMTVKIIRKSLMLAGAIAFIYFYPIRPVFRVTPVFILIPLAVRIMILLVIIRGARVFLRAFAARTENVLFHRLYLPMNRFLYGVAVYGAGYFFISRVVCYNCITLIVWRVFFEFILLLWAIWFFTLFLREAPDSDSAGGSLVQRFKPVFPALGVCLILPGMAAELAGFSGLAAYWYSGLAKSAVVIFLSVILMRLLRESDVPAHIERSEEIDEDELAGRQPYPVRWLLVRLLRVCGVAGAVFALLVAWGAPKTFLADLLYAINYKIAIGDFQLSLIGFVYAIIVLLVIYTLSVVVKEVLREWILRDTDLEPGLKDSIVRITGYVLWMAGILIALRVLGISGTALTVVFGALGIGIGFGLQNIFNNLLSGVILLFERPIQVGDVIEINGIWGTVKEINVRATRVRTFDNADLIIPNSDFISQSLTNWSFRDARIRRTIEVRVAYGSDIELVRQILIDVAYQHPRILRRPHPEVLFSDFAESALIFKLRFWAHVDWFLIVETDVRYDIDRRFRENNITIPFPQRDLHFKSDNAKPVPGAGAQEQET
ncbi:MAG: mechanosensitive ion channel domain-containing protein [Desulfosalsimonas sp.]